MEGIILRFSTALACGPLRKRRVDLSERLTVPFNLVSTAHTLNAAHIVSFFTCGSIRLVHFEIIFAFLYFANLTHGHTNFTYQMQLIP